MRKPYIEKLNTVSKFSVWSVDGEYVRDNINQEFTNFGQHYRFPFIPKWEFWIDKENAPGEEKFFTDHMLAEWRLMAQGMRYEDAIVKADRLEKRERANSELVKKIRKKHQPVPPELYIEKLKEYSGLDIWVVSGELVRDLYFIDFTEGGHHFVYSFIPKNEVWIDDDAAPEERGFIILHELHERNLMSQGMEYHEAHRSASRIEYEARHKKINLKKSVDNELYELAEAKK